MDTTKSDSAACGSYPAPGCSPRFVTVSDLPEWTVWDNERQCDLFPTISGNRSYACQQCEMETAVLIAKALNAFTENPTGQTMPHETTRKD